ncbi:hypothetical protein LI82_07100 [Methanococcoides methylutens]|uniref:DUF1614 domain-containing protein n=1 Tax=Methanococcoides methylutens TaxID=2226 RepID=A0A099T0E6_METMT|nr:DUF1614 domain-containing protein [Methanococcoides methylutens]KGK98625.1 hypothetical protein LI82_07100 [Methanococcoides methylutens]
MRGYINKSEMRMFLIFGAILLPMAFLCFQQELSLGIISSYPLFIILVLMLLGANIELPVSTIRTKKTQDLQRDAATLEEVYSVPLVKDISSSMKLAFDTVITLNVGGFIIPFAVMLFLIIFQPDFVGLEIMLIMIVAATLLSDFVNGIGIVMPDYIGLIAVPFALIFAPGNAASVIFVSGIGGILLGNLTGLLMFDKENKGSAFINLGGVGSFKAVYVTAIVAALISWFV